MTRHRKDSWLAERIEQARRTVHDLLWCSGLFALTFAPSYATPSFPLPLQKGKEIWILAASHFDAVASGKRARELLRQGIVFEPLGPHQRASQLVPTVPTAVFHNETLLAKEVDSLRARHIRAVLYDNERFPTTPKTQQADPQRFDQRFAALAHQHGLISVCDLILPDRLPARQRAAKEEVPPCDIIGLNTVQQSERDPKRYLQKVRHWVGVIRTIRPQAFVVAGISANPRGPRVSARILARDMTLVRPYVQGYWLNIPAPGRGCPRCHRPQPAIMRRALFLFNAVHYQGHYILRR